MDFEENDMITNRFLLKSQNTRGIQAKNNRLEEMKQISECVNIIRSGGEIKDVINSIKYIMSHMENLDLDDSIEIGPFILNYALDFEKVELSVISIHMLGILINSKDQKKYYDQIREDFIKNAIEKSEIICNYIQGPLSPQINDLLFSYIKFSPEMFNFSIESNLIHTIIVERPFFLEEGSIDQIVSHLMLILNITKSLNYQEVPDTIRYKILSDTYNKVSSVMDLETPQPYEIILKNYEAIFRTQPNVDEPNGLKTFNDIFQQLYDDFFHFHSELLDKNCKDKSFLLGILANFSKTEFAIEIIKKYPIYNYINPFLLLDMDEIDNNPTNIQRISLSWEIAGNFIYENLEQTKYAIENNIANHALEICDKGTIEMKSFVVKFLSNILFCVYDQLVFQYAFDTDVLEIILSLVECLPLVQSVYIIKSVGLFLSNPKISSENKRILKDKVRESDALNYDDSLTHFLDLCTDEDLRHEAAYILGYFEGENDENFHTYYYNEEEEEEAEETSS